MGQQVTATGVPNGQTIRSEREEPELYSRMKHVLRAHSDPKVLEERFAEATEKVHWLAHSIIQARFEIMA